MTEQSTYELFRVFSTVDDFPTQWGRCDGLTVDWFVTQRLAPAVRYEDVIPGYPHGPSVAGPSAPPGARWLYETDAIDELFTAAEAEELRRYLTAFPHTTVTIKPAELPLAPNCVGLGAMAVGGSDDFHMLSQSTGYPLGFSVWGYYQLDAPGVRWPHRLSPPASFAHVVRTDPSGAVRLELADRDTVNDLPF